MPVWAMRVWGIVLLAGGLALLPADAVGYSGPHGRTFEITVDNEKLTCPTTRITAGEVPECQDERDRRNEIDAVMSIAGGAAMLLGAVWTIRGFRRRL